MQPGYLLDTNHLSLATHERSPIRKRIRQAARHGHRIGTAIPALCELEVGIRQVSRPVLYRKILARILSELKIWPLDQQTALRYGAVYLDLKRRGRVLSQVDMMLSALAIEMNLVLLTTDRDFEAIPKLRTENWAIDS